MRLSLDANQYTKSEPTSFLIVVLCFEQLLLLFRVFGQFIDGFRFRRFSAVPSIAKEYWV